MGKHVCRRCSGAQLAAECACAGDLSCSASPINCHLDRFVVAWKQTRGLTECGDEVA